MILKRSYSALAIAAFLCISACSKMNDQADQSRKADEAIAKGQYKEAVLFLKNVVQSSPKDGQARVKLARASIQIGDFSGAESEAKQGLDLGADPTVAYPILYEALAMQFQSQRLIDAVSAAKVSDPATKALGLAYSGRAKIGTSNAATALDDFNAALALKPDLIVAKVGILVLGFSSANNLARNTEELNTLLGQFPNDPDVQGLAAYALRLSNRLPEAKIALTKALAGKPYDVELRSSLTRNLIDLQDYAGADAQIQEIAKLTPKSINISYLSGLSSYTQGDYPSAKEFLLRCLAGAPDYYPCMDLRGEVALKMGELSSAETQAKAMIVKDLAGVAGHRLLASTYLAMNAPERALAVLAPLIKPQGNPASLLVLAGEALLRTGDTKKGMQFLDAAVVASKDSAAVKIVAANARISAGDVDGGVLLLASVPSDPALDLTIARTYAAAKKFDKATEYINKFVAAKPKDPAGPMALGNILAGNSKWDEAIKAFGQALVVDANYLPAIYALAQIDVAQGKPEAAKARYAALVTKSPNIVAAQLALAQLTIKSGGPEQEINDYFKRARDASPASAEPLIEQARYFVQTNRAGQAVALLEPFVAQNKTNLSAVEALAAAYDLTGDFAKAIALLEKALEANNSSSSLNYQIGSLRLKLADTSGAMRNFERASQLQPNAIEPKVAIASALFGSGKKAEAFAATQAIQTEHPNSPIGFALMSQLIGEDGKTAEAVTQMKRAFEMAKIPQIAIGLYRALQVNGDSEEAKVFLRSWWSKNPADTPTMIRASEILLEKKDWKEVVAVLNEVLKVDKNSTPALNNAAIALQQLKQNSALALIERAYQQEPTNAAILDTYGWISVEQGKVDDGLKLLKLALTKAPKNPEIRLHLAQAFAKKGDVLQAQNEAKIVLGANPPPDIKAQASALLK